MRRANSSESGFTLIEAMVVLVILGIASVGIVQAVEAHVDRLRSMEQRAAALWVAENALAELRLGMPPGQARNVPMLAGSWSVSTSVEPSDDPDILLARIEVSPQGAAEGETMVSMRGFVDRGTITR